MSLFGGGGSKKITTQTATETADKRFAIEGASDLDYFAAPDSILSQPGSQAVNVEAEAGGRAYFEQHGLSGADVNAFAAGLHADRNAERQQMVTLAGRVVDGAHDLARSATAGTQQIAQATETADWQAWLPYVVVGSVVLIAMGAR
jgi:hypothetical protein